jgi:O-antigen biosynthesis protein
MFTTNNQGRAIFRTADRDSTTWAPFDPDWYLRTYSTIRDELPNTDPATVLQHYLVQGQPLGHSPNPFFDEAFFLANNLDAAAMVSAGEAMSGFDLYCRGSGRHRRPHWLFDEALYRERNSDLTDESLQAHGLVNGYHHYLRIGNKEGRGASLFFDRTTYLGQLSVEDLAEAEAEGPFVHYLRRLSQGGHLLRTTPYFDPEWYLQRYPEVADAIAAGKWLCPLHHYLANATPTEFDPLPLFSERYYLTRYPDIRNAVETGRHRNGYEHFLRSGARELRSPGEPFDLQYYVTAHRSVRADLEGGAAPHGFAHYLTIGRAAGLAVLPPPDDDVTEGQAKTLFRTRARNLLPLFARAPLDFTVADRVDLSVVMVLHNQFALTMQALSSLRQNWPGHIQLVLVDSGSSDETRFIGRYVHGADILQFDVNIGFVRGCKAGLLNATGDTVLLLNNDVELGPNSIAAALRRLCSDSHIGIVGGKIIRTHGRLQEAGCILWRDGVTAGYMRDASPLAPEANFVRDVDYCSGAFLMVRGDLLRTLDGLSDAFIPAYYEDVDLCVRVRQAGFRVVYDPNVVVHHYEYGSAKSFRAVEAETARAREVFIRRNQPYLRFRYIADPRAEVFARSIEEGRGRILFIEDQVPLRMLGSGFVRSNDLICAMASSGFQVTLFPMNDGGFDPAAVYADMPETVEVMHDRCFADLAEFLESRDGYYDTIWIVRAHNLDRARPVLERVVVGKGRPPRIVLDAEAIFAIRDAIHANIAGDAVAPDLDGAILHEFSNATFCQGIVAVNEAEAAHLRRLISPDVSVIGHVRHVALTPRPFESRSGLLFIGAFHTLDCPNYDSLCWFADEVLPLLEQELGSETRLTVAGYLAPDVALGRFRDHPRISLLGAVSATEPLYDLHRVFVAPTRFAAGAPYKVFEAASFGIPVVATELLRSQLGWQDQQDLLCAEATNPADFAKSVLRLYRDPELWQSIRESAANRLCTANSREHYVRSLTGALAGADWR